MVILLVACVYYRLVVMSCNSPALFKLFYVMAHYYILNLSVAHILYEIENLLFTNLATLAAYKFFSKHRTFTPHFSLFSSTQFGKHCTSLLYRTEVKTV